MSETLGQFSGMRLIESVYAERDGDPVTHRRSWRTRLFSWPWRPWVATYTLIPKVPMVYKINEQTLVVHPSLIAELRRLSESGRQG